MKNLILLLAIATSIFACNNTSQVDNQISQLLEKNDTNVLPQLLESFKNWSGTDADLAEKSNTVAEFLLKNKRTVEAITLLNGNIKNHFNATVVSSNGNALADIYDNVLKKGTQAEIIRESIALNFNDNGMTASNFEPLETKISAIGKRIFTDESGFDKVIGSEFITAVENFAMLNPTNEKAPTFLIDAATIARNLGSGGKTLQLFRTVYERFPNHPKAGDALFYEAFTYDADLKDFKKAEAAYKNFMETNPEHPFVDQAKVMLQNLGKSDEELLKSLGK